MGRIGAEGYLTFVGRFKEMIKVSGDTIYKAPKTVRFIDALPATGAGKVLRRLLNDGA